MTEKNLPALYKANKRRVMVIAHRGASAYRPENTMAAFEHALELDADMIELDVVLSKDGVPVIFHDAKLNNHSNGKGRVGKRTLEELKNLDAGSWFSTQFSGQKIPTLKEVMEFARGKIALNIEIKKQETDYPDGYVERQCLEMVREYDMQRHVLLSSFDYQALGKLKELNPEIPLALLYDRSKSNQMLPHELVRKYHVDAFNCSFRELNKNRLNDLKENDIPSFIYTVDQESKMHRLIKAGVSGIFTNKPDVLNQVLESYH
ncbi:MAG TPA: glycerophosphodiester phosphodiesterase family protein [Balneolaceae bacterium]|nr:glycerophosphodiester phosphodiesterase family protein [Balneolaceae bacterium]